MHAASVPAEAALFARLNAAFARAIRARPDQYHESAYAVAGYPVRIRVVGDALARSIHLPFGHLTTSGTTDGRGGLTVDLWDEHVATVSSPRDSRDVYRAHKAMPMGGMLALSTTERLVRYRAPGSTTWFDRSAQHMVGWRAAAELQTSAERTRPLQVVLPLWCLDHDIYVTHAGLVAQDGRGILVVGPSGVGKSTIALASICAGLDLLGDDNVGLERRSDGSFIGHSLFSSVRLDPRHLTNFPSVLPYAVASAVDDEPKSLVYLAEILPDRLARSMPIHAIVLPSVAPGSSSRLEPAPQRDVLRALTHAMLLFMGPNRNLAMLKRMTELSAAVPSYRLELGGDVGAIPEQLSELLCGLARGRLAAVPER